MANQKRKKKKKRSIRQKLAVFFIEVLILADLLAALALYYLTVGKMDIQEKLTTTEAGINKDADLEKLEGYTNIALFGLDNRKGGNYETGNSDTIMIASINNKTKEVKLISVYRDTYLGIGGGKFRKANAAYANGGAKEAVQMLNSNLDLDITDYVCVDWKALIDAIDVLGGIDVEVTSQEVYEINWNTFEQDNTLGIHTPRLSGEGLMRLNGSQAVGYARIRNTAGDDYLRASRQRIVLEQMLAAAKNTDIGTLTSMVSSMCDDISTSMTLARMLGMAKDVTKYSIASTTGFPFELTTRDLQITGSTVIPIDLANNVKELHTFMFGDEDYQVSETVQDISDAIENATGVTSDDTAVDTSQYNNTTGSGGTTATKEQNKKKKDNQ